MLRIMKCDGALPTTFEIDPNATFQPGMLAQLTVIGNQVLATVSDGTSPIGIIDDVRTKAFTAVTWNEVVVFPVDGVFIGANPPITQTDIQRNLAHAHVIPGSFISTTDVVLNPVDGNITFPAGTSLNFDLLGTGQPNALRTVCNYTYQVAGIPGDDSTIGSGKMTVWINKAGMFQTDQFETQATYPINANLYCSEVGLWTTRKPSPTHPCIGMVTNMANGLLELITY
jgi:hypothetical protein